MKRAFILLSAAALLLLSCGYSPSGFPADETRQLDTFTGIGVSISAIVTYSTGSSHEISIEGDDQDVKELVTKVEDGFLRIKYSKNRMKRSRLNIHITSKELNEISISGSAKIKSEKALNTEEMGISISGSGSVFLPALEAEEVDVRISGSGTVSLEKGSAEELDLKISGSGKLMAEKFKASEFSASISGSGNCRITATDELQARLSGSGGISYHGNPQVNTSSSGSGKVRAL